MSNKIDNKKYTTNKYYNDVLYEKKQIVIGHTYRNDMLHFKAYGNRITPKNVAPYTIDKSGKIYEHYDPKYYANFFGGDVDKIIIPILLVNEGWLVKDNIAKCYRDWLNNKYFTEDVYFKKWRDKNYWTNYTDKQIKSLNYLLKKITNDFNIEKKIVESNVFIDNIYIFDGIVFRSNYDRKYTDVSPAFDIKKIEI
jgi:N-acetyl-anhydromuramyl-L-alanine amidase AmpD